MLLWNELKCVLRFRQQVGKMRLDPFENLIRVVVVNHSETHIRVEMSWQRDWSFSSF